MKDLKKNSYAKLNFGLQVLNKRADGFHNINSVFIRINLHDKMRFSVSNDFSINSNFSIPEKENIIYKTLEVLSGHFDKDLFKLKIDLDKKIPAGAGLGGGSSNAAETIKACNELFDLKTEKDELNELASKIGSDVPFFLRDTAAIGKSKGEVLEPFNFKLPYHILIVYPNIHISTPNAYKMLNRNEVPRNEINFKTFLNKFVLERMQLQKSIINDFEEPVFALHPELRRIKDVLYDVGSEFAIMSGSGSSVFGLFNDLQKAEKAAESFSDYQTFITKKI